MSCEKTHVKQEHILEAAIRRFSHFGIHKTTMAEIADDLAVSKAALFYYYADKPSLIKAVEKKIVDEYIQALDQELGHTATVEAALIKLIDVQHKFLEKYHRLQLQAEQAETLLARRVVTEARQKLRERELALLTRLFQKGVETKELAPLDIPKTTALLLDTLSAFTQSFCGKALPQPGDFSKNAQKQKAIMRIVYKGLKK